MELLEKIAIGLAKTDVKIWDTWPQYSKNNWLAQAQKILEIIELHNPKELKMEQATMEEADFSPATQPWVHRNSIMVQTVLMEALRGPDGISKDHVSKLLLKWYRRCLLISAFDRQILSRPFDIGEKRGGSFTGPSIGDRRYALEDILPITNEAKVITYWEAKWPSLMHEIVSAYLRSLDELPHHFQLHLMHAVEILGYKHPDPTIRQWWHEVYLRLVTYNHLHPETEDELDSRLGDNENNWRKAGDAVVI